MGAPQGIPKQKAETGDSHTMQASVRARKQGEVMCLKSTLGALLRRPTLAHTQNTLQSQKRNSQTTTKQAAGMEKKNRAANNSQQLCVKAGLFVVVWDEDHTRCASGALWAAKGVCGTMVLHNVRKKTHSVIGVFNRFICHGCQPCW